MSNTHEAKSGPVKVQFISTGTAQIRSAMKGQPISSRSVVMRRFRSFTDRTWSEPLPIGTFLISHPNGPVLFDTGESPCFNDPGYLAAWNPTRWCTTVAINREEGIVEQLRGLGTEPSSLQAIVLSHLHSDHAGGLLDLSREAPNVPVFVSKEHWGDVGNSPTMSALRGFAPNRWPLNFAPKFLEFQDSSLGPWKDSCKVTADGSVMAVRTPGHVVGHVSLIVFGRDEDDTSTTYLLLGDATYGLDLLDSEEPDGINDDPMTAFESLKLIKEFSRQREVVVLPSHDVNTPTLLKERTVYKPSNGSSD